eukprot:403376021
MHRQREEMFKKIKEDKVKLKKQMSQSQNQSNQLQEGGANLTSERSEQVKLKNQEKSQYISPYKQLLKSPKTRKQKDQELYQFLINDNKGQYEADFQTNSKENADLVQLDASYSPTKQNPYTNIQGDISPINQKKDLKTEFENKLQIINYSWNLFKQGPDAKEIQEVQNKVDALNPHNELNQWKRLIKENENQLELVGNLKKSREKRRMTFSGLIVKDQSQDDKKSVNQTTRNKSHYEYNSTSPSQTYYQSDKFTAKTPQRRYHNYSQSDIQDPDIKQKMSIIEYAMEKLQKEDKLSKLSQFEKNRMILKYLKLNENLSPHVSVQRKSQQERELQEKLKKKKQISQLNQQVELDTKVRDSYKLQNQQSQSFMTPYQKQITFNQDAQENFTSFASQVNQTVRNSQERKLFVEQVYDSRMKEVKLDSQQRMRDSSTPFNNQFLYTNNNQVQEISNTPEAQPLILQSQIAFQDGGVSPILPQKTAVKIKDLLQNQEGLNKYRSYLQSWNDKGVGKRYASNSNRSQSVVASKNEKNMYMTQRGNSSGTNQGWQLTQQKGKQNKAVHQESLLQIKSSCTSELLQISQQNDQSLNLKPQTPIFTNNKNHSQSQNRRNINQLLNQHEQSDNNFEQIMVQERIKLHKNGLSYSNNQYQNSSNFIDFDQFSYRSRHDKLKSMVQTYQNFYQAGDNSINGNYKNGSHQKQAASQDFKYVQNNRNLFDKSKLNNTYYSNLSNSKQNLITQDPSINKEFDQAQDLTTIILKNNLDNQKLLSSQKIVSKNNRQFNAQIDLISNRNQPYNPYVPLSVQNTSHSQFYQTQNNFQYNKGENQSQSPYIPNHNSQKKQSTKSTVEQQANQTMQKLDRVLNFFDEKIVQKEHQTKRTVQEQADRLREMKFKKNQRIRNQQKEILL